MGQPATAAATLPPLDPDLDRPLEAGGPSDANADDLLAELAGEQIDKLLAESEDPPPASPAATAAAVPPQPVPPQSTTAALPTTATAPSAAMDTSSVTAAELDAVLAHAAASLAAGDADAATAAALAGPTDDPPRPARREVPLFLKPLVWANAPLAACPERLREVVGKIALVTFVNALGVLAYTLAFHRPR